MENPFAADQDLIREKRILQRYWIIFSVPWRLLEIATFTRRYPRSRGPRPICQSNDSDPGKITLNKTPLTIGRSSELTRSSFQPLGRWHRAVAPGISWRYLRWLFFFLGDFWLPANSPFSDHGILRSKSVP